MTWPVSVPNDCEAKHPVTAFGGHGAGIHHDKHLPVGESLHKKEAIFGALRMFVVTLLVWCLTRAQKMKTKSHEMRQAHDKKYGFPACFAGDNTVTEKAKGTIRISELKLGDEVLSVVDDTLVYSVVTSWLHREPEFEWQPKTCIEVEALDDSGEECRPLLVSADHLVFLRDKGATAAKKIRSGDVVRRVSGNPALPTAHWGQVGLVRALPDVDGRPRLTGLYAPLTKCGSMIVSGIHCSCYAPPEPLVDKAWRACGPVDVHDQCHWAVQPMHWVPQWVSGKLQEEGMHPYARVLSDIADTVLSAGDGCSCEMRDLTGPSLLLARRQLSQPACSSLPAPRFSAVMQFTSQQLCGGARYKPTCRIGNWCEEVELNDLRMKEYVSKKEAGDLLVISKQLMLERALQPSVAKLRGNDGTLRNGDTVMLRNAASECFLSGNAEERIPGRKSTAYAVTTGPNATPCVRNVFAVELVNSDDKNAEEPVRYGDEVRLRLRGFIPDSDCYLYSEMVSALAASKCSRKQEVGALDKPAGNTRWQILHPDGKMRFETEGEPIKADQPVVIKHLSSGSYLASDKIKQMNIFGAENEVHAHCYYSTNKTHNMNSEKKGEITGDYALRRHGPQNIWQWEKNSDAKRCQGID
ncbi:hypothetical protein FOZ60_002475 [Perkinsus olseni]|uniref:Hint domain-containing protein n=1 Tax=Perkinsus olseni TaxID=32597 RepID=A0A7J6NXV7_PEROL|nr:hypothetical protein FOZ60_002475 [Perkinsus olseni]